MILIGDTFEDWIIYYTYQGVGGRRMAFRFYQTVLKIVKNRFVHTLRGRRKDTRSAGYLS